MVSRRERIKKAVKQNRIEEEDFDPGYTARWIATNRALYCRELKRGAAETGLMDNPVMLEKIAAAEQAAKEAAAAVKKTCHDTRARARGEIKHRPQAGKGKQ